MDVEVTLFSPVPIGNDTTRPSIAPIDDIEVDGGAPSPVYFVVRASDDRDDSPTVTCRNPSGSIVVSGSVFPVGPTLVTCTAKDDANPANESLARTFTITVVKLLPFVFSVVVDGEPAERNDGRVELVLGGDAFVEVGGFQAGSTVAARMHSTPIEIGTAPVTGTGTATIRFTVPDVATGPHHLELTGLAPGGGVRQIVIPVEVIAQVPAPTTTVPAAPATPTTVPATPIPVAPAPAVPAGAGQPAAVPTGGLPQTGSDPAAMIAGALVLLMVGLVLAAAARRRRAW